MNAEYESAFASICMITYNHETFIAEAIEGVLMQQTHFPFELIIANDASTDNTDSIINDLIKNHPKGNLIKYFNHENNLGMMPNFIFGLDNCKGKYIAMCEGDDYWTDPYKLQKQVDFLEANGDYSISYHEVSELENGTLSLSKLKLAEKEATYTIEDLAEYNFIHTASVVFRNGLIKEFPRWFYQSPAGDYPLYMLNARHGKIKYFAEPMSVYRRHKGSVWGGKTRLFQISNLVKVIEYLMDEFKEEVKIWNKLRDQKNVYVKEILREYLKQDQIELFKKEFSNIIKEDNQLLIQWLEEEFFPLSKEKEKINFQLDSILNSTTYRFLKRMRIFK